MTVPVLGHVPVAWPLVTSSSWGRLSLRDTLTAETTAVQQMGTQLSVASVEGEWPRVLDKLPQREEVTRQRQVSWDCVWGAALGPARPPHLGLLTGHRVKLWEEGQKWIAFSGPHPSVGDKSGTKVSGLPFSCLEWENQGRGSTQPSAGSRETSESVWTPVAITGAKGTSGEIMVTVMIGAPDTGVVMVTIVAFQERKQMLGSLFKVLIRL